MTRAREHGDQGDDLPLGKILGRGFGFHHFVQYTVLVLTIGGSWWYMRAAVDSLKADVDQLKMERVTTVDKLARMEAKLDYLVEEMKYFRQHDAEKK